MGLIFDILYRRVSHNRYHKQGKPLMKRMLVTGGAGFIGSHVCELLLEHGFLVRVLDNLSTGRKEFLPNDANLEFIHGDITDKSTCKSACQDVEGVFHLAAMSKVLPSLENIDMVEFCTQHNVVGTQNILLAACKEKVKKVVYSASSTYYGNSLAPHRENMLPNCQTPYALTKYIGEQYCELFDSLYNLPTISLRYFQVCGPRQPCEGNYAVVAGIFIRQMRAGMPLTIHGDGSQRRDFVHVRDIAKANIKAYESEPHRLAVNIGTGISHSIKELADMISSNQILGLPQRKVDLLETKADLSLCKSLFKWTPKITFEEMVAEMLLV